MIQNTACVFASISIDHPEKKPNHEQITMIEASPYHHDILDPGIFFISPNMGVS